MSGLTKSRQFAKDFFKKTKKQNTQTKTLLNCGGRLNNSHSFDSPYPQFALHLMPSCQESKFIMGWMEPFQLLHSNDGIAGNLKQMLTSILLSLKEISIFNMLKSLTSHGINFLMAYIKKF